MTDPKMKMTKMTMTTLTTFCATVAHAKYPVHKRDSFCVLLSSGVNAQRFQPSSR